MTQYNGNYTDENGRPVKGAQVFVFTSEGVTASITDTNDQPIPQPLLTDEDGNFSYRAVDGYYIHQVWVGKRRVLIENEVILGPSYRDAAQSAAAAALAAAGVGKYANTAAGLAGTDLSDTFWVDVGGGIGQVYRHDPGPVATPLHAFIIDPQGDGAAALTGEASGTTVQARLDRAPIDPREYGATLDGVTDDSAALRLCLAAVAATGRSIHIPRGKTLLFTDQITFDTGIEVVPPANTVITGDGPTSVLRYKRVGFSSSYGLSLQHDNFTLRDLACVVDKNGAGPGAFAASIAITGNMTGLNFERVAFSGLIEPVLSVPSGQWAVANWFADARKIKFESCSFRYLDFGYVKTTHDFSTQTEFTADNCSAEYCQEVFEFNSPGYFNGVTTIGQTQITGIDTDTSHLKAGQKIKSSALPAGTTIVSIDSGTQITVSANATAAGSKRFSVGTVSKIKITGLTGENIVQWAVGMANCIDVEVEGVFDTVMYEAVHVEDHTVNVNIDIAARRCNQAPGVVGSPGSNNGAVQIMSGCSNVEVRLREADLRGNDAGTPYGVVVQPIIGNIAGSTGETAASSGISVTGTIIGEAGCKGVVAFDTDVDYRDLKVISPDSASKLSPVAKMSNCRWTGTISVQNPATLLESDDATMGQWTDVTLTTTEGAFPNLVWASGFFGANRNAPPLAQKVNFLLPSTADVDHTWRALCPAPRTLIGKVLRKYVGGQHAYEVGDFKIVAGALVPTDVFVETNSIDLTYGSGDPKQTDDGWKIDAGKLWFRAYADPAIACQVRITLTGDLFPST